MGAIPVFDDNQLIIQTGEMFNFQCQQEFRQSYEENLNREIKSIAVDFQGTRYIDSSGLGMLLVFRDYVEKTFNNFDRNIQLINCMPDVKQVFRIANFDRFFEINESAQ